MSDHHNAPFGALGQQVDYPRAYDPSLLFAIPRAQGRSALSIDGPALPFIGIDRWHAYELSWLDTRGKPLVATATVELPATTPNLIESKSLKLYLNAFNATCFEDAESVRRCIAEDLSRSAGGQALVRFGLPAACDDDASRGTLIDALDIAADDYGPPNPVYLQVDDTQQVAETLRSNLLKSNCPVTGQPDWASVHIHYLGPRIDQAGLLRYLVSFREHCEFHEHCAERMFMDLMMRCRPRSLSVQARYTRRGGLDINPWRATPDCVMPAAVRDLRQ